MTTLRSLVEKLEPGNWLLWIGEQSIEEAGERAYPNRVTRIEHSEEMIRVWGEGIRGGEYYFDLHRDGESEAYYVNPNEEEPEFKGSVVVALLTDSEKPVPVRREYADLRSNP